MFSMYIKFYKLVTKYKFTIKFIHLLAYCFRMHRIRPLMNRTMISTRMKESIKCEQVLAALKMAVAAAVVELYQFGNWITNRYIVFWVNFFFRCGLLVLLAWPFSVYMHDAILYLFLFPSIRRLIDDYIFLFCIIHFFLKILIELFNWLILLSFQNPSQSAIRVMNKLNNPNAQNGKFVFFFLFAFWWIWLVFL